MLAFLAWWVVVELFGLAALPLTRRVFAWLPDCGYAFSKVAGLLLVSYLLWFGASSGLLTNDYGGILVALLLTAGFSLWAVWANISRAGRSLVEQVRAFWQANHTHILLSEGLFLLAFAGWAVVRAYTPDKILPAGGEKYMEMAFLNGVLNSPQFPPLDPWMSGFAISYYYFGYVMMAVMTRFTGVAASVGFDLYDALLFGLTAVAAYGVVANLVLTAGGTKGAAGRFGLLGALFVGGLGNLQGLLEGLYSSRALPMSFWQWLDIPDLAGIMQSGRFYPGDSWWWWRASRVLHDLDLSGQPVIFQPIDEFPFFSFLLGDNHPHKLALPFVLLAIGLALNLFLRQAQQTAQPAARPGPWWQAAWEQRGGAGIFGFYALALGALAFLNTWDFPIYLALVVLAYALGRWRSRQVSLPAPDETVVGTAAGAAAATPAAPINPPVIAPTLALAIGLGVGSIPLYTFFYLGFASQAGGILPYVFIPTRLAQYLVMFGPFVFILAFFVAQAVGQAAAGNNTRAFPWRDALRTWLWIAGISNGAYLLALGLGALALSTPQLKNNPLLQQYLGNLSPGQGVIRILWERIQNPLVFLLVSLMLALAVTALLLSKDPDSENSLPAGTRFALLLAFTGLALTLVVEFFYLRDNFGMRMNTVFKFYFQGWVMMACASAYAAWWVSRVAGRLTRGIFLGGVALLVAAGLVYSLMSIRARTESFSHEPNLDAAASFAGFYPGHWAAHPDDWAAVQWLSQNGRLPDGSVPIILEAGSGGYEYAGRMSAFTGYPTLLGWTNHEGQWRGNLTEVNQRAPVIASIYTTPSTDLALEQLQAWGVHYVVVGDAERQYVEKLCQDPNQLCNPTRVLEKFNQVLTPVFTRGSIKIYRVPGA